MGRHRRVRARAPGKQGTKASSSVEVANLLLVGFAPSSVLEGLSVAVDSVCEHSGS